MLLHKAPTRMFSSGILSKTSARRAALACVLGTTLFAVSAWTAPPVQTPAPVSCATVESASGTTRAARALTADEQRVVCWLVSQIVHAEEADDTALEFTEADIARSLGIDVRRLDRQRIQQHVRAELASAAAERFELLD